jgi:hypothetical protein
LQQEIAPNLPLSLNQLLQEVWPLMMTKHPMLQDISPKSGTMTKQWLLQENVPTVSNPLMLQEIAPTLSKLMNSGTAFALPSWQVGCSIKLLIQESDSISAYLEAQTEAISPFPVCSS